MITEADKKELERLKKAYPLFTFCLDDNNYLTVVIGKGSKYCTIIKDGHIDKVSTLYIDKDHMEASISRDLMLIYPDLYIHAYSNKTGLATYVWVQRNNRDHESIGAVSITDSDFHKKLSNWQVESKKAKQDSWFFCTGHQKAEPIGDYGFFHFAGKYCKGWGDEHPEAREAASRETYN